jgi:hypothetical protein
MGEAYTVNSKQTLEAYKRHIDGLFEEHKYLTFSAPRIGQDRSLDQNALLHVWLTELAAHLARCHKSDVTVGMIEGMKRTAKGLYYRATQAHWMIHTVKCPLTVREKTDYTSSKTWKRGEIFEFLNWLQMFAAEHGCILESRGEHAKLTREQNR